MILSLSHPFNSDGHSQGTAFGKRILSGRHLHRSPLGPHHALLSEMPAADLGADDDSGQAQEAHLPQKPHHLLLPHQIPQIGPTKIAFPTLTVGQLITHCGSRSRASPTTRHILQFGFGLPKRACKQAGFLGTEGSKLMKLRKVYIGIHVVDPRPQTCTRDVRVSMCCCYCLRSDWVNPGWDWVTGLSVGYGVFRHMT